jgi:DNA-binding response OmpR family regulator
VPGRILIVDDSVDTVDMLKVLLEEFGCEMKGAGSIAEAEALIAEEDFSLVILDCKLPDGDGVELCARLRKEFSSLPVILYTAAAFPEDRKRAEAAGSRAYIVKTSGIRELLGAVRNSLTN